jgi:hypothetical protein
MKHSVKQIQKRIASISEDETIEISIKQLLFVYKAIEEWRGYFHNETHYPTLEEVKKYIGNKDKGMYSVLDYIYFKIFDNVFSEDMEDL